MRNNYMKLKRNTYDMNEHVRYFFDKNKKAKADITMQSSANIQDDKKDN